MGILVLKKIRAMKLIALACLIFQTNVSEAVLNSTCHGDTLVIDVPLPEKSTAKLLYLTAGNCTLANYNATIRDSYTTQGLKTFDYDETTKHAKLIIPVKACGLEANHYGRPITTRSGGLYRRTANITFGQTFGEGDNSIDIIFRNLVVAAECGKRTTYTIEFNYNNI